MKEELKKDSGVSFPKDYLRKRMDSDQSINEPKQMEEVESDDFADLKAYEKGEKRRKESLNELGIAENMYYKALIEICRRIKRLDNTSTSSIKLDKCFKLLVGGETLFSEIQEKFKAKRGGSYNVFALLHYLVNQFNLSMQEKFIALLNAWYEPKGRMFVDLKDLLGIFKVLYGNSDVVQEVFYKIYNARTPFTNLTWTEAVEAFAKFDNACSFEDKMKMIKESQGNPNAQSCNSSEIKEMKEEKPKAPNQINMNSNNNEVITIDDGIEEVGSPAIQMNSTVPLISIHPEVQQKQSTQNQQSIVLTGQNNNVQPKQMVELKIPNPINHILDMGQNMNKPNEPTSLTKESNDFLRIIKDNIHYKVLVEILRSMESISLDSQIDANTLEKLFKDEKPLFYLLENTLFSKRICKGGVTYYKILHLLDYLIKQISVSPKQRFMALLSAWLDARGSEFIRSDVLLNILKVVYDDIGVVKGSIFENYYKNPNSFMTWNVAMDYFNKFNDDYNKNILGNKMKMGRVFQGGQNPQDNNSSGKKEMKEEKPKTPNQIDMNPNEEIIIIDDEEDLDMLASQSMNKPNEPTSLTKESNDFLRSHGLQIENNVYYKGLIATLMRACSRHRQNVPYHFYNYNYNEATIGKAILTHYLNLQNDKDLLDLNNEISKVFPKGKSSYNIGELIRWFLEKIGGSLEQQFIILLDAYRQMEKNCNGKIDLKTVVHIFNIMVGYKKFNSCKAYEMSFDDAISKFKKNEENIQKNKTLFQTLNKNQSKQSKQNQQMQQPTVLTNQIKNAQLNQMISKFSNFSMNQSKQSVSNPFVPMTQQNQQPTVRTNQNKNTQQNQVRQINQPMQVTQQNQQPTRLTNQNKNTQQNQPFSSYPNAHMNQLMQSVPMNPQMRQQNQMKIQPQSSYPSGQMNQPMMTGTGFPLHGTNNGFINMTPNTPNIQQSQMLKRELTKGDFDKIEWLEGLLSGDFDGNTKMKMAIQTVLTADFQKAVIIEIFRRGLLQTDKNGYSIEFIKNFLEGIYSKAFVESIIKSILNDMNRNVEYGSTEFNSIIVDVKTLIDCLSKRFQ